jgi:hypothetical protein
MGAPREEVNRGVKLVLLVFTLTLALAACTQPTPNTGVMDIPGVRVNKTSVEAGEPVEVTLTGGFELEADGGRPPDVYHGFRLGACFMGYEGDTRVFRGGACSQDLPLPEQIHLMEGTSYVKSFGDLVIEPGEHERVSHTFSFTSNEPVEILVEPVYQEQSKHEEPLTIERGNPVRVTFE